MNEIMKATSKIQLFCCSLIILFCQVKQAKSKSLTGHCLPKPKLKSADTAEVAIINQKVLTSL